jgi:hypothetical protein
MHGTRDAARLAGRSAGIIAEGAFRFFSAQIRSICGLRLGVGGVLL